MINNREFTYIFGVSGTLEDLAPEMVNILESYNLKDLTYSAPVYGDSKLLFQKNNERFVKIFFGIE